MDKSGWFHINQQLYVSSPRMDEVGSSLRGLYTIHFADAKVAHFFTAFERPEEQEPAPVEGVLKGQRLEVWGEDDPERMNFEACLGSEKKGTVPCEIKAKSIAGSKRQILQGACSEVVASKGNEKKAATFTCP